MPPVEAGSGWGSLAGRRPRTQITCGEAGFGTWQIAIRAPHPQLSAVVLGYLGLKSRIDLAQERHLPSGEVELLLNMGDAYRVQHPALGLGWTTHRSAAVIGVHNAHVITERLGTARIGCPSQTSAAHVLFDVPMHELTNSFLELDQVVGTRAESPPNLCVLIGRHASRSWIRSSADGWIASVGNPEARGHGRSF